MAEEGQIIFRGKFFVYSQGLRHHPKGQSHIDQSWVGLTVKRNYSAVWFQETAEQPNCGRFSGSVRPKQTEGFAPFDLDAHVVQGNGFAVSLFYIACLN